MLIICRDELVWWKAPGRTGPGLSGEYTSPKYCSCVGCEASTAIGIASEPEHAENQCALTSRPVQSTKSMTNGAGQSQNGNILENSIIQLFVTTIGPQGPGQKVLSTVDRSQSLVSSAVTVVCLTSTSYLI